MTLGEIQRQALLMVAGALGDTSPAEADALINRANLEFVDRTDYLHDTAVMDLVSSQALYALPAAALRVVRVALGEKVLSPISYAELDARDATWRTTTGEVREYLRDLFGHNQVRVYPIPVKSGASLQAAAYRFSQETGVIRRFAPGAFTFNQEPGIIRSMGTTGPDDVSGTLRIDFIKYPAQLAADTDVPELPRQYHDCLSAYAAGHLFARNGLPEQAAPYLAEFENQVAKAKGEAAQTFQTNIQRRIRPRYF